MAFTVPHAALTGQGYTGISLGNHQHQHAGLHLECGPALHLVLVVCQ